MKHLQHNIKAVVYFGEEQYVAECLDLPVVTQGKTMDETIGNLQEAVELHLEDENLSELGFVQNPALLITMEMDLANAA